MALSFLCMDTEQIKIQSLSFFMAAGMCFLISLFSILTIFAGSSKLPQTQLYGFVNPNSARAASLMRLPNIGRTTAEAIVDYREKYSGDGIAFKNTGDLEKIKGIGPKTVEKTSQYLIFEQDNNGAMGNK